jgi:hypothetical protein
LHNPYLATPLSIEAYRTGTPLSDHHGQTVIAWLDRLQSSAHSPPVLSGPAKNVFQLNTHAGESEEFDNERRRQQHQHAQSHYASPGSDNSLLSQKTLVNDVDPGPYADDAFSIGLVAKLAISTSKDDPTFPAETDGGKNANADDMVRSHLYFLHRRFHWKRRTLLTRRFPPFIDRELPLGSF